MDRPTTRLGTVAVLLFAFSTTAGVCADTTPDSLPVARDTPIPAVPLDWMAHGETGFVLAVLFVDRRGNVAGAFSGDSSHPHLERPITGAMRTWKFDPGTKAGEPVDRVCVIRVTVSNGNASVGPVEALRSDMDEMPRLVKAVAPVYPEELRESGNRGRVDVRFILNTRGEVIAPVVIRATHPAFEAAAVAAITQWKFTPAKSRGKAVPLLTQQGVAFYLDGDQGTEAFQVVKPEKPGDSKDGGSDVAPVQKLAVAAVHPYAHAIAMRKGSATVSFVVGPRGTVVATRIEKASKPEFGMALAAAIDAWTFEPTERNGEPVSVALSRKQEFTIGKRDSAMDEDTLALALSIKLRLFRAAKLESLDRPAKPIFTVPPVYPTGLPKPWVEGAARVEVVVDKSGRAMLPRIVEASLPEFGWAAATAAQRWRFEPPTVDGKPVKTKVELNFRFAVPKPPSDEPAN